MAQSIGGPPAINLVESEYKGAAGASWPETNICAWHGEQQLAVNAGRVWVST